MKAPDEHYKIDVTCTPNQMKAIKSFMQIRQINFEITEVGEHDEKD